MNIGEEVCQFLDDNPTPYHFAHNIRKLFKENDYTELDFGMKHDKLPKKGFFIKADTAVLAYEIGSLDSAIISATHTDSPTFKITPLSTSTPDYEIYGGPHAWSWGGRDIKVCGIVHYIDENNEIKSKLYDSKRALLTIPFENEYRGSNPIYSGHISSKRSLIEHICGELNIDMQKLSSYDLRFMDAEGARIIGPKKEFLTSMRLDNMSSTFTSLKAFLDSKPKNFVKVVIFFDHEEIGSHTQAGALGSLLSEFFSVLIPDVDERYAFIARSLLVSSDNDHAAHPLHGEYHDDLHRPKMGTGFSIKETVGDTRGTHMFAKYPLREAAKKLGVHINVNINKNGIVGGSTIGPLSSFKDGIDVVDIGIPQLAMHSVKETLAVSDLEAEILVLKELYNNFSEYNKIYE